MPSLATQTTQTTISKRPLEWVYHSAVAVPNTPLLYDNNASPDSDDQLTIAKRYNIIKIVFLICQY